ncbi:uncharacterized protein LOC124268718 [Haliotis rubra]|uniref:uncharacterized protein LOC124268718 n=1 Tax=Haliotis rubra TaxID=36100 RepID=UPI001EE55746|nr:uncharacterized protein LOC124268718 [Haliotis rubra]
METDRKTRSSHSSNERVTAEVRQPHPHEMASLLKSSSDYEASDIAKMAVAYSSSINGRRDVHTESRLYDKANEGSYEKPTAYETLRTEETRDGYENTEETSETHTRYDTFISQETQNVYRSTKSQDSPEVYINSNPRQKPRNVSEINMVLLQNATIDSRNLHLYGQNNPHQEAFPTSETQITDQKGPELQKNINQDPVLQSYLCRKIITSDATGSSIKMVPGENVARSVERKMIVPVVDNRESTPDKFSDREAPCRTTDLDQEGTDGECYSRGDTCDEGVKIGEINDCQIPVAIANFYSSGNDRKFQRDLSYIIDSQSRNKLPHIRYIVNKKAEDIASSEAAHSVKLGDKPLSVEIHGEPVTSVSSHINNDLPIIERDLHIGTSHPKDAILYIAQTKDAALYLAQSKDTNLYVDPTKDTTIYIAQAKDLALYAQAPIERYTAVEATRTEEATKYIDKNSLEQHVESSHRKETFVYGPTPTSETSNDEESVEVSTGDVDDLSLIRRSVMNNSKNAVERFDNSATIAVDAYSSNISNSDTSSSTADVSSVRDVGNVDINSQDDVHDESDASTTNSTLIKKRPRRSGSASSKRSKSEAGYKSYKCTSCDRFFPCSSALDRHRQNKHPPHVVCHTCSICGKALYHPSHIYIHMRTHV